MPETSPLGITVPFATTISSGGGFTRLVRRYCTRVRQACVFVRTKRYKEKILWDTSTDAKIVRTFGQKLLTIGLQGLETAGNMTSRIVYESQGTIRIWTLLGSEPVSPGLNDWYLEVRQYFANFGPEYVH